MLKKYVIFIAAMSVASFIVYFCDKIKAVKNEWRVPENVLLALGIAGGAVGALISMQLFRHKTRHMHFYVVNIAAILGHVAIFIFMLFGGI